MPATAPTTPRAAPPAPAPDDLAPEITRTMRMSVLEGCMTQVFLNWTSGAVLIGYMLYYGATPTQLALVSSVPLLMQTAAPFAAWLQTLFPRPKFLTIVSAAIGRGAWILPPLFSLLFVSREYGGAFLIFVVGFSFLFQSFAGTIWSAWIGTVLPESRRGRYFGIRNGIIGVVGLSANLLAGRVLDVVEEPLNYQLVIAAGVIMATGGIYLYSKHYEPRMPPATRIHLRETFRVPLRNRNFRRMMGFGVYWNASVLLGSPMVYPYFIQYVELSYFQVAIWTAIAASTALVIGPRWGHLADRVGNKAILSITTFCTGSFLPLSWMLATPGDPTMIYVSGFLEGLVWSALNPAFFNLSLSTAPRENRIAYLGMLSFCTGLAGFLGGLVSGPLLWLYNHLTFNIGDFQWSGFHWLFLTTGILRMQAWRFIRPIRETRAWRTRDVIRLARNIRMIGFPWR